MAGGTLVDPPTDPDDGVGGGEGEFGGGAGGTIGSNGGGSPAGGGDCGGVPPPQGTAGAAGGDQGPNVPGGAGGLGASEQGDSCGSCRQVLAHGGNPCSVAIAQLSALASCCPEACGACNERIVRGDRVGDVCMSCFAGACAEAWNACEGD